MHSIGNVCFIAFLTALLISTVSAFNCYQCNSHTNPECADLHAHPPHNVSVFYQLCDGDYGDDPFCRTITYKFKFLDSGDSRTNRVIRSCGLERSERACYNADNDHHLEEVCQCFSDGCNSSGRLSAAVFTLILPFYCAYLH